MTEQFSFLQEWHAFTVKEVEGTITAEEALRYTVPDARRKPSDQSF